MYFLSTGFWISFIGSLLHGFRGLSFAILIPSSYLPADRVGMAWRYISFSFSTYHLSHTYRIARREAIETANCTYIRIT
jgi:hypothetical protein